MYGSIHARLFSDKFGAQSANDSGFISTALLLCEALDESPPTTKEAVVNRFRVILGDTWGFRRLEAAINGIRS